MAATTTLRWEDLDQKTREELDERFLAELSQWTEHGLTDEGIRVYLDYRHKRPNTAITTYEEGKIRKLLHPYCDPARVPDPVEQEEHVDALEVFGAKKLHLTNSQTYLSIMLVLTFFALIAFLVFVVWV